MCRRKICDDPYLHLTFPVSLRYSLTARCHSPTPASYYSEHYEACPRSRPVSRSLLIAVFAAALLTANIAQGHETTASSAEIALDKKRNYLKAIGRPFPEAEWKFLTGNAVNVKKFTASIGFKFQRDGEHDFSHPVVL